MLHPTQELEPPANPERFTLFLHLDPHLDVLEVDFAPQGQSGQLPLFRAVRIR